MNVRPEIETVTKTEEDDGLWFKDAVIYQLHVKAFQDSNGDGLGDFAGLSARVAAYSSSDDYSGESLTNPTVPEAFSAVQHAEVIIGRHVIVGAGGVLLPGATIGQGAAIGALTLVTKPCAEFGVYFGAPARKIGERKRTVLELERQLAERLQRKG